MSKKDIISEWYRMSENSNLENYTYYSTGTCNDLVPNDLIPKDSFSNYYYIITTLEEKNKELENSTNKVLEENAILKEENSRLEKENDRLRKEIEKINKFNRFDIMDFD